MASLRTSFIALLILVNSCWVPIAQAQDSTSVDAVSDQVLSKEIELLRLTTRFRLETTDRSRLKPWRLFAYNLGAAGTSNAGITTIAAERWRTWRKPATAHRSTLKTGPTLLLIGHSIVLGGLLIEGTLDVLKDYKVHRKGFDIKTTKTRAVELQQEIDRLLNKRQSMITSSQVDSGLADQEGQLLKDLRDLSLSDYAQSYVRARKRRTVRNVSYLNGAAAASTGGYMGSLCGLLAVTDRKPRLAGPAGIGFIISGANIATGPVLLRLTGNIEAHRAKSQLASDLAQFNSKANLSFDEHRAVFDRTLQQTLSPAAVKRQSIYNQLDSLIDEQLANNAKEKQRADADFKERLFFNSVIGGTKMGWGIQLANAGFGFHPRPPLPTVKLPVKVGANTISVTLPKPRGANELFAHRVAQGATTYIPGTGTWILDTLQARARGEREVYTMGAQDALPHQKLNRKLAKLEELDQLLKPKAGPQ